MWKREYASTVLHVPNSIKSLQNFEKVQDRERKGRSASERKTGISEKPKDGLSDIC